MSLKKYLKFSSEVQLALKEKRPIVALESTVIVHGLPYPDNLDVTTKMMEAIRNKGCTPAIILISKGSIQVGVDEDELEQLTLMVLNNCVSISKVSIADIAPTLVQNNVGATTVASTMYCAHMAGIKIFATGGIGGVHRGAELHFDISPDLQALRDIPVAVIASGAKAILDIGKTLEMLETFGVPILGNNTATFPTFYSSSSAYSLHHTFDNLNTISEIIKLQLKMQKGILIANPIPLNASLSEMEVEKWLKNALNDAEINNVKGKAVTPFLLKKLSDHSKGKTLEANKALLINNAQVAAELAKLM